MSVSKRFDQFLKNISLTDLQLANGRSARDSVVRILNMHYYGIDSGSKNSHFIGSWAKHTRIRPPRDVDVEFFLPVEVKDRFDQRSGNKQSQLLQEVRLILLKYFTRTEVKGDGPTVFVPLSSYLVELVPSFRRYPSGSFVCDTSGIGSYKHEDYQAQIMSLSDSDVKNKGNTRHLIRMMKCWQRHCSVPLRSFLIELTAVDFLEKWGYSGKSSLYYDWMTRDYFEYLLNVQGRLVFAPGTFEPLYLGHSWVSKVEMALLRARKACNFEGDGLSVSAGEEWQKIFGTDIPKYV